MRPRINLSAPLFGIWLILFGLSNLNVINLGDRRGLLDVLAIVVGVLVLLRR